MSTNVKKSRLRSWGEFRFSVVGQLLASPPHTGDLKSELEKIASRKWNHPTSGELRQFSFSTIERWYYSALKNDQSPVSGLSKKLRSDKGHGRSLTEEMKLILRSQYDQHRSWSYRLHTDNLLSTLRQKKIQDTPSYPTVKRYLQMMGFFKERNKTVTNTDGQKRSLYRKDHFEIRSYEVEYVNGLWHLDFHHCSREIMTSKGELIRPLLLCILDDHSRLICHIQWYLGETAENLVHGFIQAVQKRSLPRSLMSDNGSAMTSNEFTSGLKNLGILHETTLPYSPYQNGKQERVWGQFEGRLMAMLENKKVITLKDLNDITHVWSEFEYNKKIHSETNLTPIDRFINNTDVGRKSPSIEELKKAFRKEVLRTIRKTTSTISLSGKQYEVPYQYRHLQKITIKYAEWDLSRVDLINEIDGAIICQLYPESKLENSKGLRKKIIKENMAESIEEKKDEYAPLLLEMLATHASTGLPLAYIPKED
jgi:putative transposase